MSGAVLTALADVEADDDAKAMRQWAYFPQEAAGHGAVASPQTFRLLIESAAGRLVIATITLRTTPDISLAANLARLIDERQFELASRDRISGEFEARHGLAVELIDIDLDGDDPLKLTAAIPRVIAQASRRIGYRGSEALSLSSLRTSVTERLVAEWLAARSEFIFRLNPEAVAQARAIDGLRPSSYSYLNSVSTEHQRNRAQAMTVFPLLQPVLMTPQFDAVRKAIDEGRSLTDALAKHHEASKAMIRALRGVTPEDLGQRMGQLATVVKLLREIPPNWWPRDRATWRQFSNAATTIARVSRHPVTTAANQLWLRRCAQNSYHIQERTPEDLVRLGQEIDEFMDALRRALYWVLPDPRNASSHAPRMRPIEIAAQFKAGIGLDKLSLVVRRFGDAYRRAVTEFAEEAELWRGVRWPSIGDGPCEYGDLLIHPLGTPRDLKDEGSRMGNCVASYVENCMKGKSQIWSVRLRDGSHLSTLETRIRSYPNGRKVLEVEQHKGVRNGAPPAVASKAAYAHAAHFSESPKQMQAYLDWRQTISRQPLETRQRHALMVPIVTALERTLSGRWAWRRLIEMGSSAPDEAADPKPGNGAPAIS